MDWKAWLRKWWPSIAHVLFVAASGAVIALDSTVKDFVMNHVAYEVPLGMLWGIVLHWAQSPHVTSATAAAQNATVAADAAKKAGQ